MKMSADLRSLGDELIRRQIAGESGEFLAIFERAEETFDMVNRAFSGSWLGYHSRVYYRGFETPPPGRAFNQEWGLMPGVTSNRAATEGWSERHIEDVENYIYDTAQIPDLSRFEKTTDKAIEFFEDTKAKIISKLSRLSRDD